MEIYANVDEADVGRVRTGQPVTFSVNAYPNREFRGEVKLVRLGSQTIQNVVIYTAVISFQNQRRELLPGMTATLRIISDRRDNVVRVPNSALRWRPAGTASETPQPQQSANPFGPPQIGRGWGGGGGQQQGGGRQMNEFVESLKTELGLDANQREQIDAIVTAARPQFAGLMDPSLDRNQRLERVRQIRADMARRIETVLTEAQRPTFADIRARYEGGRGGAGGQPGRVFVVGADGKPQAVAIRLGATDGSTTEVVSGAIEPGREVIIGGGPPATTQPAPQRGFRMF